MTRKKVVLLSIFGVFLILILAGVFSCSRLPTIVPDLTRSPGPAVQLDGSRGPLSAKQSKAIIEKLQQQAQRID